MPHAQMLVLVLGTLATIGTAGKTALVLLDVQDCFLNASTTSGKPGSLSVPASHIIPLINSIRNQKGCLFDKVILSQDFHPVKHISFGSTHGLNPFSHLGGKGALPLKCLKPSSGKTGDSACCPAYHINKGDRTNCDKELCPPAGWDYTVNSSGIITGNKACTECASNPAGCLDTKQAMWTDHCLQTGDSTFPPSLVKDAKDIIVKKGTNLYVDAYSGFMDNTQNLMTELDAMLQKEGVDTLYVAGIATDVCVHATVRDAFHRKTGKYTVKVIKDATAAVLGNKANYDKAIEEMKGFGATIMTTADVLKLACPPKSKTCFKWTQHGVDTVAKENKSDDYDKPKVNGKVTARVVKHFRSIKYLETAIKAKMIESFSCVQEGDIVSLANSLHALWVSLVVVALAFVF